MKLNISVSFSPQDLADPAGFFEQAVTTIQQALGSIQGVGTVSVESTSIEDDSETGSDIT